MAQIKLCEHIKDDGIRCGSPALRGHTLCYFHDRAFRRHSIRPDAPCHIPIIHNKRDLEVAASQLMRGMQSGQIDPDYAKPIAWALQISRSLLNLDRKANRSSSSYTKGRRRA